MGLKVPWLGGRVVPEADGSVLQSPVLRAGCDQKPAEEGPLLRVLHTGSYICARISGLAHRLKPESSYWGFFFNLGNCMLLPVLSGSRGQTSVPEASAEGHHSHGDAAAHQVPASAGEYCQEHR